MKKIKLQITTFIKNIFWSGIILVLRVVTKILFKIVIQLRPMRKKIHQEDISKLIQKGT